MHTFVHSQRFAPYLLLGESNGSFASVFTALGHEHHNSLWLPHHLRKQTLRRRAGARSDHAKCGMERLA